MTRVAVVSRGWLGDSIACTAAAARLAENGKSVDFYHPWPQLQPILEMQALYRPILYNRVWSKYFTPAWLKKRYDRIIIEPTPWSYQEPFTAEIQRLADISPINSLLPVIKLQPPRRENKERKRIAISRDIYKRSYGRDVDALVKQLSQEFDIDWVGLDPKLDSKKGVRRSLQSVAEAMLAADLSLVPEGGLLWFSGLIGARSIYMKEHIVEIKKVRPYVADSCFEMENILGTKTVGAEPLCSNRELIYLIKNQLSPNSDF
jgi:hypothetical protein